MDAAQGTLKTEYRHDPVLLHETLDLLDIQPHDTVCDCTLGGAGHSRAMAAKLDKQGCLIGIDQDDSALLSASARLNAEAQDVRHIQLKGNFGDLDALLQQACIDHVDAFLFDLGVSSPQLDIPERGFSYREDAFLDMRMDPGNHTITAAEIVNTYNEADLARILHVYGEERFSRRIARAIVERRKDHPIERTTQLVDVIKQAIPASARQAAKHPARRTFQALRIEVNRELEVLERGLDAAFRWLAPEGRVAVISYHSLEDRLVKRAFQDLAHPQRSSEMTGRASRLALTQEQLAELDARNGCSPVLQILTKKPVLPSTQEIEMNPRARSAKLRVARKLEYPR